MFTKYKEITEQAFINLKELEKNKLDIRFVYGHSRINTFQTRPSFVHLFLGKRVYLLVKSKNKKVAELFNNLSQDAKIGILTHELSHVVDYEKMSLKKLIVFSFKYLTSYKEKENSERRVDLHAAQASPKHNLAWKLSKPKIFNTAFEKKYWRNVEKFYLHIEEVEELLH
jgi:hypothetical protein